MTDLQICWMVYVRTPYIYIYMSHLAYPHGPQSAAKKQLIRTIKQKVHINPHLNTVVKRPEQKNAKKSLAMDFETFDFSSVIG